MDCKKCEENIDNNAEKKANKNKKIVIICLVVTAIVILGIIIGFKSDISKKVKTKYFNQLAGLSFSHIKSNSEELNLTEDQKAILNYFDNDYFRINEYEDLQRYPAVYKNANIQFYALVDKIVKSTDEEYEVLVILDENEGWGTGTEELSETEKEQLSLIIRGKQLEERLVPGDCIQIYGRYLNVETIEINGKSYTVPTINVSNVIQFNNPNEYSRRFDLKTITTVAKAIFGDDIKIGKAEYAVDSKTVECAFYVVELDDQSNSNFQAFNLCRDFGYIEYNARNSNLPISVQKNLYIAMDFNHYIVLTYDEVTKHAYVEYFDKNYDKLWSREFALKSGMYNILLDYTFDKMSLVVDNDLYLLDIQTGKNIIEPVLVGEKLNLSMLSDGILLIGNNNKDAIMKLDYNGNIVKRLNADTEMNLITNIDIQFVNDKIVMYLGGNRIVGYGMDDQYISKYIVLNKDGDIELSTTDKSLY